jgi:RNA polymerase sigma factor (sigma-70 family)
MKATDNKFEIAAILKIKHAALLDVVTRLGSQTELGRQIEVNQATISDWCRLVSCPPKEPTAQWPAERLAKLETDLFELTGQTLDQLFPDELRDSCKKRSAPMEFERRVRVERFLLKDLAASTTERLLLPSPADEALKNLGREELAASMKNILRTLGYREQQIIKLRWGLDDGETYTVDEIAKIFKVTKARITQIEAKALRKLRDPKRSQHLIQYLED